MPDPFGPTRPDELALAMSRRDALERLDAAEVLGARPCTTLDQHARPSPTSRSAPGHGHRLGRRAGLARRPRVDALASSRPPMARRRRRRHGPRTRRRRPRPCRRAASRAPRRRSDAWRRTSDDRTRNAAEHGHGPARRRADRPSGARTTRTTRTTPSTIEAPALEPRRGQPVLERHDEHAPRTGPEPVCPPAEDAHHDHEQRHRQVEHAVDGHEADLQREHAAPDSPPMTPLATIADHLVPEGRHAQPLGDVLGVVDRARAPSRAGECWIGERRSRRADGDHEAEQVEEVLEAADPLGNSGDRAR